MYRVLRRWLLSPYRWCCFPYTLYADFAKRNRNETAQTIAPNTLVRKLNRHVLEIKRNQTSPPGVLKSPPICCGQHRACLLYHWYPGSLWVPLDQLLRATAACPVRGSRVLYCRTG